MLIGVKVYRMKRSTFRGNLLHLDEASWGNDLALPDPNH